MTIYGYECRQCGQKYTSEYRGDVLMEHDGEHFVTCSGCLNDRIKRKYSVAVHRPMARHFNSTTQSEIGSQKQFERELKMQGEIAEEKSGVPTQYEIADPEMLRAQVESNQGEGLDATNKRLMNEGKPPIRLDGKSVSIV
jgi:hypothetical protein